MRQPEVFIFYLCKCPHKMAGRESWGFLPERWC